MTEIKNLGLLNRKNFTPEQAYQSSEDAQGIQQTTIKEQQRLQEKKVFKNQQGSIKISNQSKEELEALMKITNTKYNYEIIDLLIDWYVEKELTPAQRKKFKLLTEI
ncbi:hypothetical protein JDS99_29650 [Bacillus cereus group sp. N6]|uniref:hypothetical protein n=1 Tax=Bacillus cereus group sp. N6 TaxID=2794583 RepID=UPI0018F4933C|nr:hypothetical protein [Bacillus cereus group sp. N6]MBJ8113696.1 hypothetical protein [Bacillus cereus group sp. N6]